MSYEIPTKLKDEPDLEVAELLGVINKMSHSNKRLEGIIKEYQAIASSYDHKAAALRDERDRARHTAAVLEAECANCWGPVHSQTIAGIRMATMLELEIPGFDHVER